MDKDNPKIKLIREDGCLPTKGKNGTFDLYAYIKTDDGSDCAVIPPNGNVMICVGVMSDLPENCAAYISANEKFVLKKGVAPLIQPTVISSDNNDEWHLIMHNFSSDEQTIYNGERVATFTIVSTLTPTFEEMITYEYRLDPMSYTTLANDVKYNYVSYSNIMPTINYTIATTSTSTNSNY